MSRSVVVAVIAVAAGCGPGTSGADEQPGSTTTTTGPENPPGTSGSPTSTLATSGEASSEETSALADSTTGQPEPMACDLPDSELAPGTLVWATTQREEASLEQIAFSETDDAIYVVGGKGGALVRRLDVAGNQQWERSWGDEVDSARIALPRPMGGVMVGVDVLEPFGGGPCMWCPRRWLVAFDGAGDLVWDKEVYVDGFQWHALAGDDGHLLLVGGPREFPEGALDIVELDDEGEELLRIAPTMSVLVGWGGFVRDVARGPSGELALVGQTGTNVQDVWIGRLSPDGNEDWSFNLGPNDYFSRGIAVGLDGHVFATVDTDEAPGRVQRWTPDGVLDWEIELPFAHDVAVDCDGHVAVATSYSVAQLDPSGTTRWTVALDPGPTVLAVTAFGDVLATGEEWASGVTTISRLSH